MVFTGFGKTEAAARAMHMRWEDCSTPFVAEEDGRVIAHAGVLEIPLVIAGRERVVAGMHARAPLQDACELLTSWRR